MDLITPLLLVGGAGLVEWKTGWVRHGLNRLAVGGKRSVAWVTDEAGAYASLAEQLPYRDFYQDGLVETADGLFWCGFEALVPSTDGYSHADTNELGRRLNRCLAGLPSGTLVQTINRLTTSATDQPIEVLQRIMAAAPTSELRAVYQARIDFLRQEATRERVRIRRTWVFIGRPVKRKTWRRIGLRGLWSPQLWIDLERREYLEVRADCFRVRDSFQGYFRDAGARVRNITDARTVMALAYQRLNPERAEEHPCPEYGWEWNQNPRELVCLTSMDDLGDVLRIGNRVVATLVLHRLPVKANPQTLERVLRSTALNFDVEFATHFEIGDWVKWDNRLAKEEDDIALSLDQSRVANRDETIKAKELAAVRTELRESEEKIGVMGFAATVSAETPAELRRRADTLMVELRKAEGMETILDRAGTVTGHIATLPCAPHKDARTKPVMTRDAANLSGWTGGPAGVLPEEATLVFQRPDGGLVYVDQTTRLHGANQTLVCGRTRSGKSFLMNLLRLDHLARGRRGMVLDYRASGRRITEMIGGLHIDITDPRQSSRLGIFDIHPKSWELFAPEALTPEGLPRDRVLDVERMLEKLCLDPLKLDEVSLAPRKRLYLGEVVRLAYYNKVGGVPTLDDFIRAAKNATRADRDIADDVAARLSLYGSGTSLGRFLNDQEEAADLRDVPLIYFDFRHAKNDPRLLLVATMAVQMVLDRYLFAQDQLTGTFLHLDEVQTMTRWPVLALTIDDVVRTAGKYNTHVTAGSQHPEDFDHPLLKSLAHNCEVKYLFQMPAGLCRRVFDLTPGQAQLVASLDAGGDEHRDCALISPTLTARLRLRFGPVDGRLLMEASTGREKFTAAEALQCLGQEIPARLRRALEMEVKGQPGAPQELMTSAAD